MPVRLPWVTLLLVAPLLASCSPGVGDPPEPLTVSAGIPTSASPLPLTAGESLAVRARLTAGMEFTARYSLVGVGGAGLLTVSHRLDGDRLELDDGSTLATLLRDAGGTVACSGRGGSAVCLLVAPPGAEVPAEFDPGVQRVFVEDLARLAANQTDYDVVDAVSPSPSPDTVGVACWQVAPRSGAVPPTAPAGVYCLDSDGVPTSVTYPSGTLTLTERLAPPGPEVLVPPTTPQPLP